MSGYDDTQPDLLDNVNGNYQYLNDSTGKVTVFDYYTDTTAGDSPRSPAEHSAPEPGHPTQPDSVASKDAAAGPADDQEPPGVAPWVRCFTEERRPFAPTSPGATDSWQVRASAGTPYGKNERQAFAHDAAADTVLALLGDPAEPATSADLLGAARDALRTGRLVAIAPGPGLTGLCASLHAENPALGITLIRALPGHGLQAARRLATATRSRGMTSGYATLRR